MVYLDGPQYDLLSLLAWPPPTRLLEQQCLYFLVGERHIGRLHSSCRCRYSLLVLAWSGTSSAAADLLQDPFRLLVLERTRPRRSHLGRLHVEM